jgi:hypothetical protein
MRNVQLMKKNIYIFRVYHIRIIAHKKIGSHDMKQKDSSIIIVRNMCARAYLSIHDYLSFLHEVMIGNHRTKTFLHEVMIGNHRNKTTES